MNLRIVLFLLAISLIGCKSHEPILLRLKYAKGDERNFTLKIKCFCSRDLYLNSEVGASFHVDSVTHNSDYLITSRVDAIKMDFHVDDIINNELSQKYDSNDGLPNDKYDAILDGYYTFVLNNMAEVTDGYHLGKSPQLLPFNIGIVQLTYPEKKVGIGDSWTTDINLPLTGTGTRLFVTNCTFTYTINNITDDKVIIDVEAKINSREQMNGVAKSLSASGAYTIYRKNGQVKDAYLKIPQLGCDDALISVIEQ
jgi:hypothetical protein